MPRPTKAFSSLFRQLPICRCLVPRPSLCRVYHPTGFRYCPSSQIADETIAAEFNPAVSWRWFLWWRQPINFFGSPIGSSRGILLCLRFYLCPRRRVPIAPERKGPQGRMRPEGFRRSSANADIRVPVASVLIQAGPRSLTESSGGADSALELSNGAGPPPKRRPLSRGVVGYWGVVAQAARRPFLSTLTPFSSAGVSN